MLITGEEPEFSRVVEKHARFVFRVAWAVVRNVHDAEDVVQETFLKLYRNGAWKEMKDEKAFLARATWRMAVDQVQLRHRENAAMGPPASFTDPEQDIIVAGRQAEIHRMIDSLPEDLRQPLALSGIQDLNSRQIGKVMGISEGTVRTRIMRARQLLKQKLAAREG